MPARSVNAKRPAAGKGAVARRPAAKKRPAREAPQARGDLAQYNAKRRFDRTPEPPGKRQRAARSGTLSFFIQRHHARSLHYDFRLEGDGALKSWAVPKGPSLDPDALRLAVQVEDHPLSYGSFEGAIPAGEYGAGDVVLWDRGTWVPREDPARGLERGKLHFELRGEKLRGHWALFRTGRDGKNWMLRKLADEHARAGDAAGVLTRLPDSVLHARRRAAAVRDAAKRNAAHPATKPTTMVKYQRAGRALPAFIRPQLATLSSSPPTDDAWRYEIKYDGYRMLARVSGGGARIYSRNEGDWTRRLPALAQALATLAHEVWLDGEIVVFDAAGHTSFQALQNALDRGRARDPRIVFMVFDLLFLDGADWRDRPWSERVDELRRVLAPLAGSPFVRLSEPVAGDGAAALKKACALGLEGLIAKRVAAPYLSGRHDAWRKLKCHAEQELVIVGYTEPAGSRQHLGALLLGVHDAQGRLRYAGRVGTGFSDETLVSLRARLGKLAARRPALDDPPRLPGAARVHWVRPELVAQVRFAEWTDAGNVRQGAFLGLREDKEAVEVKREASAEQQAVRAARKAPARTVRQAKENQVGGIAVTNPERVVYAHPRSTKLDVVRYYDAVSEYLFPELANRPVSLMRCPQGVQATRGAAVAQCFFQKHLERLPKGMRAVRSPNPDVADYVAVEQRAAIVALAQNGTIEFHTWGARLPKLDMPDRIIFDLDPDPGLDWPKVIEAALLTRTLLQELGLPTLLKTTGGKGLHVVVPVKPVRNWEEIKSFARALAMRLAHLAPERFTATLSKARRTGKVFVDYLRNGAGATAVAAYSLRARPGAPVAMPIDWDELTPKRDLRGDFFNIGNAVARAAQSAALWRDADRDRVTVTLQMMKRAGA